MLHRLAPRVDQGHHTTNPIQEKKKLISLLRALEARISLGLIRPWIVSGCYPVVKKRGKFVEISRKVISVDSLLERNSIFDRTRRSILLRLHRIFEQIC